MQRRAVVHEILERLAPLRGDPATERIWRFSERMAAVYQEQMRQFDTDSQASRWRQLYSVDNMPPPSDTKTPADVAAMMAFYSPTNYCKFQKLVVQQLLGWESRQTRVNPYPFGVSSVTIVDIGAGVGIATLATIDVLATWLEILEDLGYGKLGMSVNVISVEPDTNKQRPRQNMLRSMSRLLDRNSILLGQPTEITSPYPEPQCIEQILAAASGGSLAVCCMSNFVSSPFANPDKTPQAYSTQGRGESASLSYPEDSLLEWSQNAELDENAIQYAKATAQLLADLPAQNRLLLAAELKQRGAATRAFASLLYPGLELSLQWNRVRFYSPEGSYWHSLRSNAQTADPDWATGFWSLAHWGSGSTSLASGYPGTMMSNLI